MVPVLVSPLIPLLAAGMMLLSTTITTNLGDGWQRGHIGSYQWEGKVYDLPSKHGIDGGRISKLRVNKNGKTVVHYDRGWDIPPGNEEDAKVINDIQKQVGDKK
jgi:hypothetical protein